MNRAHKWALSVQDMRSPWTGTIHTIKVKHLLKRHWILQLFKVKHVLKYFAESEPIKRNVHKNMGMLKTETNHRLSDNCVAKASELKLGTRPLSDELAPCVSRQSSRLSSALGCLCRLPCVSKTRVSSSATNPRLSLQAVIAGALCHDAHAIQRKASLNHLIEA